MDSTNLPLLLTIDQAAALVGFAPTTISKWLYGYRPAPAGWPSPVKAGRSVRYRRVDIESWVEGLVGRGASLATRNPPVDALPRRRGRPRKIAR